MLLALVEASLCARQSGWPHGHGSHEASVVTCLCLPPAFSSMQVIFVNLESVTAKTL